MLQIIESINLKLNNPDGTNKTVSFDHWTITAYDENMHRKAYVLDAYGRIVSVLEYNNDPVLRINKEFYTYNTTYTYDTTDNLIKITDALGNTYTFTYDTLGRRISLTDPDIGTWSYSYDESGNLIKQTQNGGGNLVTGDGYYREYNGLNQLVKIRNGSTSSAPQIENYTYDPFGQRVKIMRNDSAKTVIYTPFKEFMRIKNSTGTYDYTYIYQDGILVARVNPDGSKWYYHSDQLGSTTLVTDQNGNVVEQTFYSPYGEIIGGGTKEVKLYTGQFKDNILCQYYYGKRYFSPCWGIFIQFDPTTPNPYNPQYLNRYAYALNNPYKYVDTTGLLAVQVGGGVSGGAGILYDIIGIGGGVGGGLVISHDQSVGWQVGSYTQYGGGLYVGKSGASVGLEITITPSAKTVKDVGGLSASGTLQIARGPIQVGGICLVEYDLPVSL